MRFSPKSITRSRAVFEAYVEKALAPSLRRGQVAVMDNLTAHKGERVREIIEERGCELVFLPPYSTDFNPIEQAFSKLKGLLRRAEARTREALIESWERRYPRSALRTPRASSGTVATGPRPNCYDSRSRCRLAPGRKLGSRPM
jgi:transposase